MHNKIIIYVHLVAGIWLHFDSTFYIHHNTG